MAECQLPTRRYGFPAEAFDFSRLPDVDTNFLPDDDLEAFVQALHFPDPTQSPEDTFMRLGLQSSGSVNVIKGDAKDENARLVAAHAAAAGGDVKATAAQTPSSPVAPGVNRSNSSLLFSAHADWSPIHQKVQGIKRTGSRRSRGDRSLREKRRRSRVKRKTQGSRTTDETREGYLYGLLKWPFLLIVGAWIIGLAMAYLATRTYVYLYEQLVAWRGQRERLRRAMRRTINYKSWVTAAKEMDEFLGNSQWREDSEFAYYDSKTVRRVWDQMRKCRASAQALERSAGNGTQDPDEKAIDDLKVLIEACVKNNFVGVENPRLYSQTYYGTKNLVQNFVDEVEKSIKFLIETKQMGMEEKRELFRRLYANYGRTALCLSGGATFAYYHFGVVKALLEEDLLPNIITGTSGGALVAALVATRTNEELKELLVPALAHNIQACSEPISVWLRRWWTTGARFDSVEWAKNCSWFTRGSMTFREAYERTGRILNVSCVPADPHSPTILCNYRTSPDCVIWSAVLASAAVPGILNPVVLMMKTRAGKLAPYSFGHKWKDGSLRTDIPVQSLNLHFNVNFTIVSQVNPHVNLFFFSSRGSVGQPVTHRKGRGWRGGYLGSATEQYIKLDLTKWLKVLRHLELLPRPLGQDWSQLWLQQFGGTITIWPKCVASDFWRILSDPDEARLARMLHEGQQSAFPKLKFVANRLKIERLVEAGARLGRGFGSGGSMSSEEDLQGLLQRTAAPVGGGGSTTATDDESDDGLPAIGRGFMRSLSMLVDGAETPLDLGTRTGFDLGTDGEEQDAADGGVSEVAKS